MTATCTHFWLIDPATGKPTSTGVCQKCGQAREFLNYVEIEEWNVHTGPGGASKRGRPKKKAG